jgi:hypothetical protein
MEKGEILACYAILVVIVGILGCGSNRSNLAESGSIHVKEVPSEGKSILGVRIYEDGDRLLITGKVRGLGSFTSRRGHIDIAVIGPDGEILEQSSAPILPRTLVRRQTRNMLRSHFGTQMRDVPPSRSTIHIAYHGNIFPIIELRCSENKAVYYSK